MTGPEISSIPREARPYQGHAAGVVTRIVANTIDAVIVGVIVGSIYLGFVVFTFLLDPRTFVWPSGHLLASITTALFVATVYLFLSWWLFGRSYGDHVMGLRVVGRRGRRLGPLRSLLRAGFCVVFPIGLFWCLISPERRSVQDLVLWTRVVYDWMPRPTAASATTLVEPDGNEQPPAPGEPGAEPAGPDSTSAPRRFRRADPSDHPTS